MRHAADIYVGIPFVAQGNTREGVNCWGVVQLYYREQLGIELRDYPHAPEDRREIAQAIAAAIDAGEWTEVSHPKDGDMVTMAHKDRPFHVGVSVAGRIMHATLLAGMVIVESPTQLMQRGYGRLRYLRHE